MFLSRAAYGLFQGSVEEYANVTFPKLLGKKILLFFFFPPPFLSYLFIYLLLLFDVFKPLQNEPSARRRALQVVISPFVREQQTKMVTF